MTTSIESFLSTLKSTPADTQFSDVIALIEANYIYTAAAFKNGETFNEAGQNAGSCKIFAFAKLNQLDEDSTLQLFGDYYRKDVLANPEGNDHQNIRQFMQHGWTGIDFNREALALKN